MSDQKENTTITDLTVVAIAILGLVSILYGVFTTVHKHHSKNGSIVITNTPTK